MDAGSACCGLDGFHILIFSAKCDIGFQCVREQEVILRNVSDIFTQCFKGMVLMSFPSMKSMPGFVL